jgi:endoglucanase
MSSLSLRMHIMDIIRLFFAGLLLSLCAIKAQAEMRYCGINLAGAEFGKVPGRHKHDYIYPSAKDIRETAVAGFNLIRLPVRWARLQPELSQNFNRAELARLDRTIRYASSENITLLIDVHDYGFYKGQKIGSEDLPVENFLRFWRLLAYHYKDQNNVVFGIMNEPHRHSAHEWADIAQKTILAIRETGATNLIMVPGTYWSGAHSWTKRKDSNGDALKNIHDPANNIVFEMHQYLDKDSSGTSPDCVSEDVGAKRLELATQWLRENNHKGFLGEFGAAQNPICLKALDTMMKYMHDNADAWTGWAYWASSVWFGDYKFNIYPASDPESGQLKILKPYLETCPS